MGSTMTTGSTSTMCVRELAVDIYESTTVSKTIDPKGKPEKQQENLRKPLKSYLGTIAPRNKSGGWRGET